MYRRTMGGEINEIPVTTVGDIVDGFNFVFAEEPQPYESYARKFYEAESIGAYDFYPDPIESLFFVITNGQGDFEIDFGNPYARHFPFWWGLPTPRTNPNTKWWNRHLNWQDITYPTTEAIEYIFNTSDNYVYAHPEGNLIEYEKAYRLTTSGSFDVVNDTSGNLVYVVSPDINSEKFYLCTSKDNELNIVFTVLDDKIYNAGNALIYTIETDSSYGDKYICKVRSVNQTVNITGFEDDYNIRLNPSNERAINSGESLITTVNINGVSDYYGSALGYLTFKQRANFATGYSNYKEFATVPMVIANVANGNAAVEPLIFDIIITDDKDNVVSRKKFQWDVQEDLQQDLGTFYVIESYNDDEENQDGETTTYHLETRITNRTGTRYELYRYDGIGSRNGDFEYRDNYRNIMPDYWKYDLTRDSYGTLPDHFLLDAHSQIAPGLVTVYGENIGEGYSSMIVGNVITDSFRLYEYSNPTPKNLSFTYRRVGGMTKAADEAGAAQTIRGSSGESSSVQAFTKYFADDTISKATLADLLLLTGKIPAIIPIEILNDSDPVRPLKVNNAGADTTNSFQIYYEVPEGDDFITYTLVEEEEESSDQEATTQNQNNEETQEPAPENEGEETQAEAEEIPAASFEIKAASTDVVYDTEGKVAILPLKIRMTLPRNNSFIRNYWEELDNAENSEVLFDQFADLASVWVKVPATIAYDGEVDLFKAVNTAENRGGVYGVRAADCIDVSINNDADELYVDFVVFLADAEAPETRQNVNPERPQVSAFIYTFEDDKVPYILIGDGKVDKFWNLTFFLAAPDTSTSTSVISDRDIDEEFNQKSSSGGTCNFGFGISILLICLPYFDFTKTESLKHVRKI